MGKILEGETAIITGGGSGIGQGTAVRFATEGANVLVVDKDPNGARKTAELGGGQSGDIELLVQDVTAQDAPTIIFDTCGAKLGGRLSSSITRELGRLDRFTRQTMKTWTAF